MVQELFSSSLPAFSEEVTNPSLKSSLLTLEHSLGEEFRLLTWTTDRVAVPITINVELPPLGTFQGIDIRHREPVILVFDTKDYPGEAPMVFSNRLDFPKDKLAHLYIAVNGRPPGFCYVRGSRNDWYANKMVKDLLIRISNWLRDAAAGELTQDGAQFEPLRIEGYAGTVIYDYDQLAKIVQNKQSLVPDRNFALALFERITDGETSSYKLVRFVTLGNIGNVHEEVVTETKKGDEQKGKKFYHYGYLIWSNEDGTFGNYYIDLPKSWQRFKEFCATYQIDLSDFEPFMTNVDGNFFVHFPVIVGIKRPSTVIGFSSNIEFVNFRFRMDYEDYTEGKVVNDIPVELQAHRQPLTLALARRVSGSSLPSIRSVVFGCGALGSKVIMHFARSGFTDLTLIDPDTLNPHNLVRHALSAGDEGVNKAVRLQENIQSLYPFEKLRVHGGTGFKTGLFDLADTFSHYAGVMDFTASESFFNKLASAENMNHCKLCSGSISDFGNLGILFKEGTNRNPRIDDLQVSLYSLSRHDVRIQEWLARERQAGAVSNNLTLEVGVGCNSETTVLSDEKVSTHAAYFTGVLKKEMSVLTAAGKIFLCRISDEGYSITTEMTEVGPFETITTANDSSWTARFRSGVLSRMRAATSKAGRKETGGVFVGVANWKTKTIHITDLIDPPPDSSANSTCFYRGHEGLPEQVNEFITESGGQLGYVGEWHSHPEGPEGMSTIDCAAIRKFKREFSQLTTPLPVFLAIVTPTQTLCYIY